MKLLDITKLTNKYLAGEQLPYAKLVPFLDAVIDDINSELNATYPAFSELEVADDINNFDYNFFPDKYIRTVVCLGAALKFYAMDEEGEMVAQDYQMRYQQNMFYMVRDYIDFVPFEYESDSPGGLFIDEHIPPVHKMPFRFDIWRW